MVQFWVSIFPMPRAVIRQIICLCRNFLWTVNTCRTKSTLVAWKTICLPKNERGLGLLDIQVSNNCFIAKHLWNIHLKQDSIWIRWIHRFYLTTHSIWNVHAQRTSSLLLSYTGLANKLLIQWQVGHRIKVDSLLMLMPLSDITVQ